MPRHRKVTLPAEEPESIPLEVPAHTDTSAPAPVSVPDIPALAEAIADASAQSQAALIRERLLLDWNTKKRPTKPQQNPGGLFEGLEAKQANLF